MARCGEFVAATDVHFSIFFMLMLGKLDVFIEIGAPTAPGCLF